MNKKICSLAWNKSLRQALLENSVLDARFGHVVTHDFAEYHIAAHADVADIEAIWLDEVDPHSNPMGSRGIGEIGIVGPTAAVAIAAWHAHRHPLARPADHRGQAADMMNP